MYCNFSSSMIKPNSNCNNFCCSFNQFGIGNSSRTHHNSRDTSVSQCLRIT
jgi:hypothetical protein